jgi:beta-mannosidase
VEFAGARAFWFFAEYRDSALEAARLRTSVEAVDGGVAVTVTAENLVRDITLLVDKVDPLAVVDDQMVTLLPGESVVFHVRGSGLDAEALVSPSVLRTANQLVADWA